MRKRQIKRRKTLGLLVVGEMLVILNAMNIGGPLLSCKGLKFV